MASDKTSPGSPRQVCRSCKARKRRCNKALPKCLWCSKRNLQCVYPSGRDDRTTTSRNVLSSGEVSIDDESLVSQRSISFPTMLFLDPTLVHGTNVNIPPSPTTTPEHVKCLLGDLDKLQTTVAAFFAEIHPWMPIVSRKRCLERYLLPEYTQQSDVALLLLCITLVTGLDPTGSSKSSMYTIASRYYNELTKSDNLSFLALQSGVLLALFELGNGIYPAAYTTVGACARFAHALGLPSGKIIGVTKPATLVEVEERRRVWWAIVILDRFVNIGCPGRPFSTADPGLDELLPADDEQWDRGIVDPGNSMPLSSPMTSHMSKFGLLCQTANLLGSVLKNASSSPMKRDDIWVQLDRTLHSLLAAALALESPDSDSIAFIYSTLVALYPPWIHASHTSESISVDRVLAAKAVMQEITRTIKDNLVEQQCFLGRNPKSMSPWGLFFAYRVCSHHMFHSHEVQQQEVVESLKEGLRTIDVKWKAAGVYLRLLETQQAIHSANIA